MAADAEAGSALAAVGFCALDAAAGDEATSVLDTVRAGEVSSFCWDGNAADTLADAAESPA